MNTQDSTESSEKKWRKDKDDMKGLMNKGDIPSERLPQYIKAADKDSFIVSHKTLIMPQKGPSCSAYSAAHLLEWHHIWVDAEELYSDMPRFLDSEAVRPEGVADEVNKILDELRPSYPYRYRAVRSNTLQSLKYELNTFKEPVLIAGEYDGRSKGWDDLHYVLVAGYDKEYIYIIDSIEHAFIEYKKWNRKVKIDEFKTMWSMKKFLPAKLIGLNDIMLVHDYIK